jgi:6-phosphogluconolactonase
LNQELYELSNQESLCRQASELILDAGQAAIKERGFFTLVLTGGTTVQALYTCLAESGAEPAWQSVWTKTFFFLGDERWVADDHPDNNGGMARRLLFEPLGIREDHVFLIRTDLARPDQGAADYEQTIRDHFKTKGFEEEESPVFDMILFSMGSDGHVASLFAGTEALEEKEKLVTTSFPPLLTPAVDRVTISLPVINNSRAVMMLISGADRRTIAQEIMADPAEAGKQYPAGRVRPTGLEIWLVIDS